LRDVPKKHRRPELCLAAVLNAGMALEHMPEKLKTPLICLVAVRESFYSDEVRSGDAQNP